MPRVSEKKRIQNDIDKMIRVELAAQLEDEETCGGTTEEEGDEFIDDLLETSLLVSSTRYGNARSAGSTGKLPLSSAISLTFSNSQRRGSFVIFGCTQTTSGPSWIFLSARGGDDHTGARTQGKKTGASAGIPYMNKLRLHSTL